MKYKKTSIKKPFGFDFFIFSKVLIKLFWKLNQRKSLQLGTSFYLAIANDKEGAKTPSHPIQD